MILKVQPLKSLEDAINYLLNVKDLEKRNKLLCVRYRNIQQIADPAPELLALGRLAPKGSKAFYVATISLEADDVLSPRQWELLGDELPRLLSESATLAAGNGKREKADFCRLKSIWPVHIDTANQHMQPLICMVDPRSKRLLTLNGYYDYFAFQFSARRLAERFWLKDHPHNMDPIRTVGDDGIVRYTDVPGRTRWTDLTLKHAAAEAHRGVESALRVLRRIHQDKSPEQFNNWEDYGEFLKASNAGVKLCGNGLRGYVDGRHAPMGQVSRLFELPCLEMFYGSFPESPEIGAPVNEQRRIYRDRTKWVKRLPQIAMKIARRDPAKARLDLQAILQSLPVKEIAYRVIDLDWNVQKRGTAELSNLSSCTIEHLLQAEARGCEVLFTPLPEPGEVIIPVPEMTLKDLQRLKKDYDPAIVVQTGPDNYSSFLFVRSLDDPVKSALAARSLAQKLCKEYGAKPAVPGTKIPLPGLHRTASTGFAVRIETAANILCVRASQQLRFASRQREENEARWWRGASGKASAALQTLPPSPDVRVEIYRAHAYDIAATAMRRCHTSRMLDERIARRLLISGNPREMAQEVICRGAPLAQGVARDEDWPKYAADVVVEAVRLLGNRKLIAPEWQKLNRDAEQAARAAAEADRETENRRKATLEKNKPATKQPELEQRAPSRELVSSQTLIRQMKAQTKERFAIPITKEVARAIEARVAQAQGLQQELAKLRCDEVLLEVVYADGVRCNSGVYDVGQIMGGVADVVDLLLRRPWLTWDYTVRFLPPCPVGKQWLTAHQMDQAKFTEFSAAFRPAFAVRTGSSPPCYYAAVLVDALMDPRENQKAVEMVEFEWLCSYSDRHCRFPHCNPGSGQGASAHFPPILPPGLPLPGLPVAGGQENVVLVEEDGTKCSAVDLLRRVLIDPAAAVPPPAPDQANPLEQKVVISIKQHDAPTAAPTLGPNIWGEQRKPEQASDKAPQGEEMTVGMPVWEQDTEGREDKKDQENALEHEDQRLVR